MPINKTYLVDSVEVVKTGRTAERLLRKSKKDIRIEITPADKSNGTWTKWIKESELFEIIPK